MRWASLARVRTAPHRLSPQRRHNHHHPSEDRCHRDLHSSSSMQYYRKEAAFFHPDHVTACSDFIFSNARKNFKQKPQFSTNLSIPKKQLLNGRKLNDRDDWKTTLPEVANSSYLPTSNFNLDVLNHILATEKQPWLINKKLKPSSHLRTSCRPINGFSAENPCGCILRRRWTASTFGVNQVLTLKLLTTQENNAILTLIQSNSEVERF